MSVPFGRGAQCASQLDAAHSLVTWLELAVAIAECCIDQFRWFFNLGLALVAGAAVALLRTPSARRWTLGLRNKRRIASAATKWAYGLVGSIATSRPENAKVSRMCGRVVVVDLEQILEEFSITRPPPGTWFPRYNLGPTSSLPVIRLDGGSRRIDLLRWGLIPSWAKEPKIGNRMFNARIETLCEKPVFRSALRQRRCIVAVSGYFEWQQGAKPKQPYYVDRADGHPLAMAGLWDSWTSSDGEIVETCTIVTRPPAAPLAALHDRMPAILPLGCLDAWLDLRTSGSQALEPIALAPLPELRMVAVGSRVNSVANDGPECIAPREPADVS